MSLLGKQSRVSRTRWVSLTAVLLCLTALPAVAQFDMLEEIPISFEIPRLLQQDMIVQYDGASVFLPLIETFTLLDFQTEPDFGNDRLSGTFGSPPEKFVIDLIRFRVTIGDGERDLLRSDYFYDGRDFYLRINLYEAIFGLRMSFDFSELKVVLPVDEDFPAFQKLKRAKARKKLEKKRESLRDVRHLERQPGYIGGGVADWRLSTAALGGGSQYYNVELGGLIASGDLRIAAGGSTNNGLNSDNIDWLWHRFIGTGQYVTQAELGRIQGDGVIMRALTGLRLTNQPQIRREYFKTISLTGTPGAAWEVELWIDNKLIDYMTTDADGRYFFNVDVFYGSSNIELRLYGPNGEMRTERQYLTIPFKLIPKGVVEYSAAFGSEPSSVAGRAFGQVGVDYGVINRLTVGLNFDQPLEPYVGESSLYGFEATGQIGTNLTLAGSFSPAFRSAVNLNYYFLNKVNVGASAAVLAENIVTNPVREKNNWQLSLSGPLSLGNSHIGLRYNIAHHTFQHRQYTNMTYGFNVSAWKVHLNYVGQASLVAGEIQAPNEIASKIMGSVQIHRLFRPQFIIDYDHTRGELTRYSLLVSRRLWRDAQISVSYEANPAADMNSIMANFSFQTNFLDFSSRTRTSSGHVSAAQFYSGSVRYDQSARRVLFERRRSIGYGSAVVRPFFDENYNGLKDDHEEHLSGLRAEVSGVGGRPRGKDRIYYYDRLRPYDEYLVKIDEYSLDNPTLRPSNENYRVTFNPNVVTEIEVPIVAASEISGSVRREVGSGTVGVGSIKVMLLNISKDILMQIQTFSDGEFFSLGLLPGSYRAYLDAEQLARSGWACEPAFIEFDVRPVLGGEILDGLDFKLVPAQPSAEEN